MSEVRGFWVPCRRCKHGFQRELHIFPRRQLLRREFHASNFHGAVFPAGQLCQSFRNRSLYFGRTHIFD